MKRLIIFGLQIIVVAVSLGSSQLMAGFTAQNAFTSDNESRSAVAANPIVLSGDWTVEFWVKPTEDYSDNGTNSAIALSGSNGEEGISFLLNQEAVADTSKGSMQVGLNLPGLDGSGPNTRGVGQTAKIFTGASAPEKDVWTHLAFSSEIRGAEARKIYLYINGVEQGAPILIGGIYGDLQFDYVGDYTEGNCFKGDLDELIVRNVSFSDEIKENFERTQALDDPTIVNYYKFDDDIAGTTIADSIGGNDFTANFTPALADSTLPLNPLAQELYGNSLELQESDIVTLQKNIYLRKSSWTVEFSAKTSADTANLFLSGPGTEIKLNDTGKITVNGQDTGTGTLGANVWNSYTLVFDKDSGQLTTYVNGVRTGNEIVNGVSSRGGIEDDTLLPLEISTIGSADFTAEIDELRFWSTNLSAEQVVANLTYDIDYKSNELVAYYKMDQPTTDDFIVDFTRNGHSGTFTATSEIISPSGLNFADSAGIQKNALSFTSPDFDDYATVNSSMVPETGDWSVDFWVKPGIDYSPGSTDNRPARSYILSSSEDFSGIMLDQAASATAGEGLGKIGFTFTEVQPEGSRAVGDTTFHAFNSDTPAKNTWTHLAFTFNSATRDLNLYVNGVLDGNPLNIQVPFTLNLDQIGSSTGNSFLGELEELKVWNEVIGQDYLNNLRRYDLPVDTTALTSYYKFDEDLNEVELQDSVGGKTATLQTANTLVISDFPLNPYSMFFPGNAIEFDAGDNISLLNNITSSTDWTLEFIVNPTAHGTLFSGTDCEFILDDQGKLAVVVAGVKTTLQIPAPAINRWTKLSFVYDATTDELKVYVNGSAQGIETIADFVLNIDTIGDTTFEGTVDEIVVWSAARSAGEISTSLIAPIYGEEANILALYKADQNLADTVLHDYSFGGNVGYFDIANPPEFVESTVVLDAGNLQKTSFKPAAATDHILFTTPIDINDNDISVGVWVNPSALTADALIYDFAGIKLYANKNNTGFVTLVNNTTETTFTAPSPVVGTWTHLLVTISADGETKLIVNGVEDATPLTLEVGTDIQLTTIGSATESMLGEIEELKIWNIDQSMNQTVINYRRYLSSETEENLTHYYQFDNKTGSIINTITTSVDGNVNDANLIVDSTLPVNPQKMDGFGNTLAFNIEDQPSTLDDMIILNTGAEPEAGLELTGDWTIDFKIKLYNAPVAENTVVITGTESLVFNTAAGKIGIMNESNVVQDFSTGTSGVQAWNHVALVNDSAGGTLKLYVNGQEDATQLTALTSQFIKGIGSETNSFSGVVDEFKIWDSALNNSQIGGLSAAVLTGDEDGLIALYKFDQPSGNSYAHDYTFNSYYSELNTSMNTVEVWIPSDDAGLISNWQYAINLDGIDDRIELPLSADLGASKATSGGFTFMAWVKPNVIEGNQILFAFDSGSDAGIADNGGIYVNIEFDNGAIIDEVIGQDLFTVDSWSHVAIVYDKLDTANQAIKAYVNGLPVGQSSTIANVNSFKSGTYLTYIAGTATDGLKNFSGAIDEIRVWSNYKFPAQVKSEYIAEVYSPVSQKNLICYYQCDENNGTMLADISGEVVEGGTNLPLDGTIVNTENNINSLWSISESVVITSKAFDFDNKNIDLEWEVRTITTTPTNMLLSISEDSNYNVGYTTRNGITFDQLDVNTATTQEVQLIAPEPDTLYIKVDAQFDGIDEDEPLVEVATTQYFEPVATRTENQRGCSFVIENENGLATKTPSILDGYQTYTAMAWIKVDPKQNNGDKCVLGIGTGTSTKFQLTANSLGELKVDNGLVDPITVETIETDAWAHVAIVISSSTTVVYVNGNTTPALPEGYGFNPAITNEPFRIGYFGEPETFISADIDEVSLWVKGLSSSEVRDYTHRKLTGGEDKLVMLWDFEGDVDPEVVNTAGIADLDGIWNGGTVATDAEFSAPIVVTPTDLGAHPATKLSAAWFGYPRSQFYNGAIIETDQKHPNSFIYTSIANPSPQTITFEDPDFQVPDANEPGNDVQCRTARTWYISVENANLSQLTNVRLTLDIETISGDLASFITSEDATLLYRANENDDFTIVKKGITVTTRVNGDDHSATFEFDSFTMNDLQTGFYALGYTGIELTPVDGVELTTTLVDNGVEIEWTAENEIDVDFYQIRKLVNGNWVTIATINPGEAYAFLDTEGTIDDQYLLVVTTNGVEQLYASNPKNNDVQVYQLTSGWNLLSNTLDYADLSELKNAISGEMWTWNGQSYEVASNVDPLTGFWVYSENERIITVSGTKSTQTEIDLIAGWNLVGVSDTCPVPEEYIIYTWNEAYQSLLSGYNKMYTGVGYWLFTFGPETWEQQAE